MDKILDIGDIFDSKLASFSVPAFAVLICTVIFFLTRQEPKKFESSIRQPRKTAEVGNISNSSIKKKKRNNEQSSNVTLQKKKENREAKSKKESGIENIADTKPLSNKDVKANNLKLISEVAYNDGEGEWQTVTTKRQKKNNEQLNKKGTPKKKEKIFSIGSDALDAENYKSVDESVTEQSAHSKAAKKIKKRALRE